MRALVVRAAFVVACVPATAGAQTLSLTESEALAQLTPASPRVQAARASVDVARAGVIAAGRWPDPRVTFNREAVAGVSENMFMVSQVLPVTGRRQLDESAATARLEATSSRAEERVRRLGADLRLVFTDLWAAQVREQELTRTFDRLRDLADVLRRREASGEAAGFDRLRAEREVIDIDADRASASTARAIAQAELASFLADPVAPPSLEAVRPARGAAMVPSVETLMATAEETRGDLVALSREVDAAGFTQEAAGRRQVPEPEVVAGMKRSSLGGGDIGSVISVHFTVPVFDRSRPERAAAEAQARQARAEIEVFRRTLRAQIVAWRTAVVERREMADRYREAVSASADQIERIAQVSYDAGERSILDLLDAYRTASSARVRQALLDAGVREAEIELEFVSGWGNP